MSGWLGFGLRGQLAVVLTVSFVAAFALLLLAAQRIDSHQQEQARSDAASRVAEVLATLVGHEVDEESFATTTNALLRSGTIVGAALVSDNGQALRVGATTGPASASRAHTSGAIVRVWLPPRRAFLEDAHRLLPYGLLTGLVILILSYFVLTILIVRPVDTLTRASEQLAEGRLEQRVPLGGAAEMKRLAVAFNTMSEQLREDRAALKRRLAELEATTNELLEAREQVIRADRLAAVGRLSAGVAHEIGNPLTAIQGLLELLQDGSLEPAETTEFLARIQSETSRIHKIINDLLDFSRPDQVDTLAQSDLATVVRDTARLITPQKRFDGVQFEIEIPAHLPKTRGAPERLRQLLLNLFFNAADAMAGKGTITVQAQTLEHGQVRLVVADDGPGLSPDIEDKLFEPFVTTKPPGEGTGLGLAVSHALVERLGGTICAANRPGGGCRFEVTLPIVAG